METTENTAELIMDEDRGLAKRLWHLVATIIAFFFQIIWGLIVTTWAVSRATGLQYVQLVEKVVERRGFLLTKAIAGLMYIFTPIAFLLAPVGIIVFVAMLCVAVDQTLEYDESAPAEFSVPANEKLSKGAKVALLFNASHYQLEKMMNRFPYWSANDPILYPQSWWDNSKNTQRGVWWATSQMVMILSDRTTRYGTGQPENPLTLAASKKFNFGADEWNWWMADSEMYFVEAIDYLKQFEAQAIKDQSLVNVRTDDLEAILMYIKDRILGEPYGRLTEQSDNLSWTELDDVIMFSRGAAIVARDELVVLRSTFGEDLSRGGLNNLDEAIGALGAVIDFHPWLITRGSGDSMLADHRSKLSRYYSQAFRRIEDLVSSLRM